MCIRGAYRLHLSARGGVRSRRHLHACRICTVPVGHAGRRFVHPGGTVMSDGEGSGPCRWGRAGGRRMAAACTCAAHPVIASVRHGWSWPGDVPSPSVMESQACMPGKSPSGGNHPRWSAALPARRCGRGGVWLQIFTEQFAFNYRSRKDWEDFPSGFLSTEANLSELQPRKHLISGK